MTNRYMSVTPSEEQQRMAGYGTLERAAEVLETAVARRPYVASDRFTAADVYVGSGISWCTQFGLMPKMLVSEAYLESILSRPAYKRAGELDAAQAGAAGWRLLGSRVGPNAGGLVFSC